MKAHLLSALCQLKVPHLTRKKKILAAVQQAMAVFNPYLDLISNELQPCNIQGGKSPQNCQ